MCRVLVLIMSLSSLLVLTGCPPIIRSGKDTGKKSNPIGAAQITPASAEQRAVIEPAKPGRIELPETKKGIRVDRIEPIACNVSNKDGLFLGERIDATHLCDGSAVTTLEIGSPRFGVLKAYGPGHIRYYPPQYACEDSVTVSMRTKDGCNAESTLAIEVKDIQARNEASYQPPAAPPENPTIRPEQGAKATITITEPNNYSEIPRHRCPIEGRVNGIADGLSLDMKVVSQWGQPFPQSNHPIVSGGQFNGMAYIGDEFGGGIGEAFRIVISNRQTGATTTLTVRRVGSSAGRTQ